MVQPEGQTEVQQNGLAEPFSRIFTDRAEADWAFDLLRETARRLQVNDPYDQRLAVTLTERSGKLFLRLNFGGWTVLGFRGPGLVPERVDMALLASAVAWDERLAPFVFEQRGGEPEVRSYELPLAVVRPMTSQLQQAYETTLDFITDKFRSWKKAIHWKRHNPELVEAFFDLDKRARLFAGGLSEPEFQYERHFTAFHHELAEEEGVYEVEEQVEPDHIEDEEIGHLKLDQVEVRDKQFLAEPGEILNENDELDRGESYLPTSPSPHSPISLPQLAEETGLEEAILKRYLRAIERKKQVILYGPPGTGKTFLAERLARYLVAGGDGFVELVQFHPAYAYEDFMQGLRPEAGPQGELTYNLLPGRFLEFCQKAGRRQGTCVLIIDEINRANLARVFGELMYLLEYRERAIPLAGGGLFQIPANVRLIGTMNTADRSIALVDHALRRRFAFLALQPDYALLRRYHQRQESGFPVEGLIKVLTRLNRQIGDPHYAVGVTFFLRPDLAAEIEDIWAMEIEPYLEEYFFDQPASVDSFRWPEVKREIMES